MLKIGVLGANDLAKIHIRLLIELKDMFEVVGFYEPNDLKAALIIDLYGIKRFLSYEELLTGILKLLSPTGSFCVILPNKEGEQFRDMAEKKQLHLTKLVRIHTRTDKTEKRLLMKFEFTQKSFSEESITIEKDERHTYTEEYKELTKDYYLNF